MQILLISPPFSQLNTPYASLPFLKGYLKAKRISSSVFDLGIKTAQRLYSKQGLERLKENIVRKKIQGDAAEFFTINFEAYINTIKTVTSFLKGEYPEAKNIILSGKYLPVWKMSLSALDKNTANLSGTEYAQYLASLYLEDIFLFYRSICPEYGFSSYAEKLALSPPVFDGIKNALLKKNDLIDKIIEEELQKSGFEDFEIIAFTIPFPGMLKGALKAADFIKRKDPDKIIVLGGGYVNTELRSLTDPGIFDYADFICLDDGEVPLLKISEFVQGKTDKDQLVRTYCSEEGKVKFYDNPDRLAEIKKGTPDYSDTDMSDYIPVFESVNPMMRLWSEKNTLKLRLAKGCYWHKCNFCDTSLPYIRDYSSEKISDIVDDIKKMTAQTKLTRFHFTDEAIPPASAIKLALELLRQNIKISWWGNIRFDKAFTEDVCRLLKQSGFTAAVGGLESGCSRTLLSMNKGVTVEDAVNVIKNFKSAGILVHVYMIYGFPTETARDLIDSAEILRQLFEYGLADSAFWHRFALTVHSPVFRDREKYNISVPHPEPKPFANNDIPYIDRSANEPDKFGEGLKKATYNFMLGIGTDEDIGSWFDFTTPEPSVRKTFVREIIEKPIPVPDMSKSIIWLGGNAEQRGNILMIEGLNGTIEYELSRNISDWLKKLISSCTFTGQKKVILSEAASGFPKDTGITFEQFLCNRIWDDLFDAGLLII